MNPSPFRIAILAFDGVEALDLAGPYEVFTTAVRMAQRLAPGAMDGAAAWQVDCVARTLDPVQARAGLRLLPSLDFTQCPQADLLVVPGGVVDEAVACPATRAWVARVATGAQIAASVCTGAFILAASGVLTSQRVTTHWEDIDDLHRQFPALQVEADVRWVDEGRFVTSAGISAGIDMSLHLVERLADAALAARTARQMDYPWQDA
ncbi:thiamine biosynthesis protein ThiJ [Rhodoferax koreense]|uniref:Thiamine biosynthesis protein ThiJ n=1 Tax=Rhodoferax koreensis TaxID=1842727 RepID=A0A1P8JUR7_9BURK|nr:DJ-1/PfpI family protein [Rhodoferax koreense]APW37478.1 thiamine biosynthesis protein ThiJ [Rhodoferax koreense]